MSGIKLPLFSRRFVLFRYTGPDEDERRLGLGWAVYEVGGKFYGVDTIDGTFEERKIDETVFTRVQSYGRLRTAIFAFEYWWKQRMWCAL
jgi:hypothetical protein